MVLLMIHNFIRTFIQTAFTQLHRAISLRRNIVINIVCKTIALFKTSKKREELLDKKKGGDRKQELNPGLLSIWHALHQGKTKGRNKF